MDYVVDFQSVDSEIVLWEPKMKEQSPGEVRIPTLFFLILRAHEILEKREREIGGIYKN
jgi:hypothetical protein